MKKTWEFGVTGYQLMDYSHDEIIELVKDAGIRSVEANQSYVDGLNEAKITSISQKYEHAGVSLESFHLPFGQNDDIASFYETDRKRTVSNISDIIEKANILGSSIGILHPTTNRYRVDEEGFERFFEQMKKSLDTLLPIAERCSFTIVLENMLPGNGGHRYGSQPEHFQVFQERIPHEHLGFCLDTGHAHVSHGPDGQAKFIEVMGDKLTAFHLQDNAGDRDSHLAPGHGTVNWSDVFRCMSELNIPHSACIEAPPFAFKNGPANAYNKEAWKALIENTTAIANRVF